MSKVNEFKTAESKVFNAEISKVVTSLKGADKSLVDLVAAAGYRWFGKDKGGNNVIENLVKSLNDFPLMQEKVIKVLKTFTPLEFEPVLDDDLQVSGYKITTVIALSALSEDAKAAYNQAIDDFVALDLKRITDYGKKAKKAKEPVKLDVISTSGKITKSVESWIEKAVADGVDKASVLNTVASWIEGELAKLKPAEAAPEVTPEAEPAKKDKKAA